MGLTKEEREAFEKRLKEDIAKAAQFHKALGNLLERTDFKGKITREEAVQMVQNCVTSNFTSYIDGINENIPGMNLTRFTSRETRAKQELSRKALTALTKSLYDHANRIVALEDAVKSGELTQNDVSEITSTRDRMTILTDGKWSETRDRDNIDFIKALSGKGLDPEDPQTPDIKNQMAASVWNSRLKEIIEFNYDKFAACSDEELVENWADFYEAFQKVSVFKAESGALRKNPYVDTALIEKSLAVEAKYTSQFMYFYGRLDSIANPYYASFDNMKVLTLSSDDYDTYQDTAYTTEDPNYKAYVNLGADIRNGAAVSYRDQIAAVLSDKYGMPYAENRGIFDKNGIKLNDFSILDYAARGETVYACNYNDPDNFVALDLDAHSIRLTTSKAVLDDETKQKLRQAVIQNSANHVTYLQGFFYSSGIVFTEGAVHLVDEIKKKNLDYTKVKEKILDHYREENNDDTLMGGLSKEEFIAQFHKHGLKPKILSKEESQARKGLTLRAIEKNLDIYRDRNSAFNISEQHQAKEDKSRLRSVHAVCFKSGADDVKYNESVIDRLYGTAEQQKQVVEEIYRRHLANAELFRKPMTDEQIVDNWANIRETGLAMGMEYDNFQDFIKSKGIKIGDKLQAQMDETSKYINETFVYLKGRMDLIGSKYYQYGCEDVITDPSEADKVMGGINDPEFVKSKCAMFGNAMQTNYSLGYGLGQSEIGKGIEMQYAFDADGNEFTPDNYYDIGCTLRKGQPINLVDKSGKLHVISADRSGGMPAKYSDNVPTSVESKIFELRKSIKDIKASEANTYDKNLAVNSAKKHIELMKIVADPKAPNFEEKLKDATTDLCTAIVIEKMVAGKNLDDETMKSFSSEKSFNAFRKDLISSGLTERMNEAVKDELDKIHEFTPEDLYKSILKTQAQLGKERYQKQEKVRQDDYIKFRDGSVNTAKNIDQIFRGADAINSDANFFNGKITQADLKALHQTTELKGMTLERNSLKSLTLGMMLTQGFTVEEAFSAEHAEERGMIAEDAKRMVEANDYQTIRENLIKGLNVLNDYVSDKMQKIDDYSLSNLVKPENRMLLAVDGYIKDMSQEFVNCQSKIKPELQLNIPATDRIRQRAERLGLGLNVLASSKYEPSDMSFEEVSGMVKSYVKGEMYNKYIKTLKGLPENRDRNITQVLDAAADHSFIDAYADASIDLMLDDSLKNSPEKLQKIYDSIKDDTFRKDLDIRVQLPDNENPELKINTSIERAVNKATKREPLNKKTNPELDKPIKQRGQLSRS